MIKVGLTLGLLFAVVISTGCGSLLRASKDDPKTLLSWSAGRKGSEASNEDSKPDDASAKADEPDEEKPLVTDRPDFTEASSTVGKGRVQLEAGYTFFRDRSDGVVTSSHSYPESLLRIGMFADWFEFRIAQNFGNSRTFSPDAIQNTDGAEDLYLGVKLGLTEQKGVLPESALILQSLIPTGSSGVTSGALLPGANLLYGWEVVKDRLSLGGSSQGNRRIDETSHEYIEFAQSITVGYTLTKKLGAYTEWFAFLPSGAIGEDVGPQHYFNGGFTYKFTPNFQYDIRAGVGLNRRADDFFAGTGFAMRY